MAEQGKRKIGKKGRLHLPKEFREQNQIKPGDYIEWKLHSRDKQKIIISVKE